jgi:hypothetical protein
LLFNKKIIITCLFSNFHRKDVDVIFFPDIYCIFVAKKNKRKERGKRVMVLKNHWEGVFLFRIILFFVFLFLVTMVLKYMRSRCVRRMNTYDIVIIITNRNARSSACRRSGSGDIHPSIYV